VPNTGRTPKRRARVAADPVQRFVMRRRVTHDFRAEQQFSRKDFFERQRHHTSKKQTHTRTLSHTARYDAPRPTAPTTKTNHDLNTSEDICE